VAFRSRLVHGDKGDVSGQDGSGPLSLTKNNVTWPGPSQWSSARTRGGELCVAIAAFTGSSAADREAPAINDRADAVNEMQKRSEVSRVRERRRLLISLGAVVAPRSRELGT